MQIAIFTFIAMLGYSSVTTAQEQIDQTSDLNSILKLAEIGDKRAVQLLIAIIKDKDKGKSEGTDKGKGKDIGKGTGQQQR